MLETASADDNDDEDFFFRLDDGMHEASSASCHGPRIVRFESPSVYRVQTKHLCVNMIDDAFVLFELHCSVPSSSC